MGSLSVWHWLIVLAVVLLLFGGRGKISSLMGDFGKGLSAFKKGVGAAPEETPPAQAAGQPGDTAKPISAQATTTPPPPSGSQVHQDSAAKV
jgi:sec-independent protein translocase protein TatA